MARTQIRLVPFLSGFLSSPGLLYLWTWSRNSYIKIRMNENVVRLSCQLNTPRVLNTPHACIFGHALCSDVTNVTPPADVIWSADNKTRIDQSTQLATTVRFRHRAFSNRANGSKRDQFLVQNMVIKRPVIPTIDQGPICRLYLYLTPNLLRQPEKNVKSKRWRR